MHVRRVSWLLTLAAVLIVPAVCATFATADQPQAISHGYTRRWTLETLSGNGWQPASNGGLITDDVFDDVQLVIRWRTGGTIAASSGLPAATVTLSPLLTIPLSQPALGSVIVASAADTQEPAIRASTLLVHPTDNRSAQTESLAVSRSVYPALTTSTEENELRLTRIANTYRCVINGLETARGQLRSTTAVQIGLLNGNLPAQENTTGNGTTPLAITSIEITELNHRSLFDGKSLHGWEPAANLHAPDLSTNTCWLVNAGHLTCTGTPGPWLRSSSQYSDFNLRLEYRLSPGGNSGVYLRVPADGAHHRDTAELPPAGVEVQVLDDAAPQYASLRRDQYAGGLYAIVGVQHKVAHPAGAWNSLEINLRGDRYSVRHNGVQVLDCSSLTHPQLALRERSGHIGLQNHDSYIEYRNIRIGPAE